MLLRLQAIKKIYILYLYIALSIIQHKKYDILIQQMQIQLYNYFEENGSPQKLDNTASIQFENVKNPIQINTFSNLDLYQIHYASNNSNSKFLKQQNMQTQSLSQLKEPSKIISRLSPMQMLSDDQLLKYLQNFLEIESFKEISYGKQLISLISQNLTPNYYAKIKHILKNILRLYKSNSPYAKICSLQFIKELMQCGSTFIFELIEENVLMSFLEVVEYRSHIKNLQRGSTYFLQEFYKNAPDQEIMGLMKISNTFFRMIHQCLYVWGKIYFPHSKFSKIIQKIQMKFAFPAYPNEFKFYTQNKINSFFINFKAKSEENLLYQKKKSNEVDQGFNLDLFSKSKKIKSPRKNKNQSLSPRKDSPKIQNSKKNSTQQQRKSKITEKDSRNNPQKHEKEKDMYQQQTDKKEEKSSLLQNRSKIIKKGSKRVKIPNQIVYRESSIEDPQDRIPDIDRKSFIYLEDDEERLKEKDHYKELPLRVILEESSEYKTSKVNSINEKQKEELKSISSKNTIQELPSNQNSLNQINQIAECEEKRQEDQEPVKSESSGGSGGRYSLDTIPYIQSKKDVEKEQVQVKKQLQLSTAAKLNTQEKHQSNSLVQKSQNNIKMTSNVSQNQSKLVLSPQENMKQHILIARQQKKASKKQDSSHEQANIIKEENQSNHKEKNISIHKQQEVRKKESKMEQNKTNTLKEKRIKPEKIKSQNSELIIKSKRQINEKKYQQRQLTGIKQVKSIGQYFQNVEEVKFIEKQKIIQINQTNNNNLSENSNHEQNLIDKINKIQEIKTVNKYESSKQFILKTEVNNEKIIKNNFKQNTNKQIVLEERRLSPSFQTEVQQKSKIKTHEKSNQFFSQNSVQQKVKISSSKTISLQENISPLRQQIPMNESRKKQKLLTKNSFSPPKTVNLNHSSQLNYTISPSFQQKHRSPIRQHQADNNSFIQRENQQYFKKQLISQLSSEIKEIIKENISQQHSSLLNTQFSRIQATMTQSCTQTKNRSHYYKNKKHTKIKIIENQDEDNASIKDLIYKSTSKALTMKNEMKNTTILIEESSQQQNSLTLTSFSKNLMDRKSSKISMHRKSVEQTSKNERSTSKSKIQQRKSSIEKSNFAPNTLLYALYRRKSLAI